MEPLALLGGPSVRAGRAWHPWPVYDATTETELLAALRAGRWTVSWPGPGPSLERAFGEEFAAYTGAAWAVAVDHGSGALVVALETLDIGAGDEVLVPAMTWVASATSVLRVGARPILVDVDPVTGCLDIDAVEEAITPRTRAIVAVHLGSSVCDLTRLSSIADRHGLALVEDCAQAHGAIWSGRQVGTWGDVGAFSFQTGKVLACGEGGAVVSRRPELFERAQHLRADSRSYRDGERRVDEMELVESGDVTGANMTMSELHAALARDQLRRLDGQHAHREVRACELEQLIAAEGGGFRTIPVAPEVERRSIYEFAIRFEPAMFGETPVEAIAAAVAAELERPVYPPDMPLHRSVLFRPTTKRSFGSAWVEGQSRFPAAEEFRRTTLLVHHSAFLGDRDDMCDIVAALGKVAARRDDLPAT